MTPVSVFVILLVAQAFSRDSSRFPPWGIIEEVVAFVALLPTVPPLAELPFERIDGRIWIAATIRGRPVDALLDTGATDSVVDSRLASALRVRRRGSRDFAGYGEGNLRGSRVDGVVARLAGSTIDVGLGHALPLDDLGAGERRLGAILGYDFLLWYVVEVDEASRRVRIYDREAYRPAKGYIAVPMPFVDRLPTVEGPLRLPGLEERTLSMMLDTGSPSGVSITYRRTKRDKLESRFPASAEDGTLGGVGGARRVRPVGRVEGRLGPVPFTASGRLILEGVSARRPTGLDYDYDAILGNEALRGLDLAFDYFHARLYVRPNGLK